VNVKAAYLLSKEVLPYLTERGGSIIYISSIAGFDPVAVSIKNYFKLGMYNIRPDKMCHLIIGKHVQTTLLWLYTDWCHNQKLRILHAVFVFPAIYTTNSINWLEFVMKN
jgi:hypothetical protein